MCELSATHAAKDARASSPGAAIFGRRLASARLRIASASSRPVTADATTLAIERAFGTTAAGRSLDHPRVISASSRQPCAKRCFLSWPRSRRWPHDWNGANEERHRMRGRKSCWSWSRSCRLARAPALVLRHSASVVRASSCCNGLPSGGYLGGATCSRLLQWLALHGGRS